MTQTSSNHEECPTCGAASTEWSEEYSSVVCSECYAVVDNVSRVDDVERIEESDREDQQYQKEIEEDWTHSVSIGDKSEANLVEVLAQVEEISSSLSLPDSVVIRGGEIITEAWESNFMHGRSKDKAVSAAVYAASRERQYSVPPGVIAKLADIEKRRLKKTFRQLREAQNLDIGPSTPVEYLDYICTQLELHAGVEEQAEKLIEEIKSSGANPVGIAGAAVYQANKADGESVTLREIAGVTAMAKETVWRHTKRFESD